MGHVSPLSAENIEAPHCLQIDWQTHPLHVWTGQNIQKQKSTLKNCLALLMNVIVLFNLTVRKLSVYNKTLPVR